MSMIRAGALALLLSMPALSAFAGGGGHFRKGEVRLEAKHVVAVLRDEDADPARAETLVYLSDVPLDAGKLAAAFNAMSEAETEMGDGSAGYVRVCINADGEECGLYFSHNEPLASFNLSGSGDFKLDANDGKHVAGHWAQIEPEEFFSDTYDFDLRFDVAVVAPSGKPLPADGGEPAAAYKRWLAAVAKGDVAALRALDSEVSDNWQLRSDDPDDAKSALKDLRDGTPLAATILRGRSDGDRAVLWVEGTDRDDIHRRGRVLMLREGGDWHFAEDDLENADD